MGKNLRALSDEELKYINEKYTFKLLNNFVVVCCNGYNRNTVHDIGSSFTISTNLRKVTISKEAISLWINHFMDSYTLIEVQNAISTLIVTYQDITLDEIENQLVRNTTKITTL